MVYVHDKDFFLFIKNPKSNDSNQMMFQSNLELKRNINDMKNSFFLLFTFSFIFNCIYIFNQ